RTIISCDLHHESLVDEFSTSLDLHSFPTRRSSDLLSQVADTVEDLESWQAELFEKYAADTGKVTGEEALEFLEEIGLQGFQICSDRKSTRLNSSHVSISYAVFCLKKKKEISI